MEEHISVGVTVFALIERNKGDEVSAYATMSPVTMLYGFAAAFVSGAVACKWMIGIVKRGKLIYFAYYCMAIGMLAIIYSFFK